MLVSKSDVSAPASGNAIVALSLALASRVSRRRNSGNDVWDEHHGSVCGDPLSLVRLATLVFGANPSRMVGGNPAGMFIVVLASCQLHLFSLQARAVLLATQALPVLLSAVLCGLASQLPIAFVIDFEQSGHPLTLGCRFLAEGVEFGGNTTTRIAKLVQLLVPDWRGLLLGLLGAEKRFKRFSPMLRCAHNSNPHDQHDPTKDAFQNVVVHILITPSDPSEDDRVMGLNTHLRAWFTAC